MKKKIVNLSPELESFLKKQRVIRKFKKNCLNFEGTILVAIGQGFIWEDSKEGHNFWNKLNDKFQVQCQQE